jgi:hypothetical protein
MADNLLRLYASVVECSGLGTSCSGGVGFSPFGESGPVVALMSGLKRLPLSNLETACSSELHAVAL